MLGFSFIQSVARKRGRLRDLGDIGLAGPVVPNLHDPVDRANHACGSWAVPPVGPLSMLFGFRRKKQRAGINAESNPSPGAPPPGAPPAITKTVPLL